MHVYVKVNLAVAGGRITLELDCASAGFRSQGFDLDAVLIEDKGAIDSAQSIGQVDVGDGAIANLKASLGGGIGNGAGDVQIYRDDSGRGEVMIDAFKSGAG